MNANNNDMLFDSQGARIRMPICQTTVTTEISDDYTLPDYQAEIRRILYVGATVTPPAKYISGAGAEFNGNVDYNILYVGSDGELYTVPLVGKFEFNVSIDTDGFDFNEGVTVCPNVTVENVTTRLTGPRKLNIKCKLRSQIRAYAVLMMDAKNVGDVNRESIESLIEKCDVCVTLSGTSDTLELSEEILPDNPDCRVVSAQGRVFITDINTKNGEAVTKGEVHLKLLNATEGLQNEVTQITRRIPFVHSVEIDDLSTDAECCAVGYVNDMTVNVEDGRIICDMGVSVDIEAQQNTTFRYVCDSYSTEKESDASYRKYTVPKCGFCINGNFSMNEHLLKENISFPEGASIIDVYGNAMAESVEYNKNKNIIVGSAKYTLILFNNDEYSSMDVILPVKYEFEGSSTDICLSDIKMSVISSRARHDSDSVSIDAEIGVSAIGFGSEEITALNEVSFGENVRKNRGSITVCYPMSGETLWSISKKYHIPSSRIERLNETNGSIDGKEYLIV